MDIRLKHLILPPLQHTPNTKSAPIDTHQPTPTDTFQPSKMPIADPFEKDPEDTQEYHIKNTGGRQTCMCLILFSCPGEVQGR